MLIPEGWVTLHTPNAVRGEMAGSLLDAAEVLGFEPWVIKAQTDGFMVPVEVHQYLYPSQFPTEPEPELELEFPAEEVVELPEPTPDEDPAPEKTAARSGRAPRPKS